jgi:peptide-methionine (S)-S-oxide reductase
MGLVSLMITTSPHAAPLQTAVFAGGCFWGVDAVFKHVRGVSSVQSGYAGGQQGTASYEQVSQGNTGHAEAVEIRFDAAQISYAKLLEIFLRVAHNPTQLNYQGPDVGTQYRSAIFYTDAAQQQQAQQSLRQLSTARVYPNHIVTEITPLQKFYPAEDYHQNYLARHLTQPYIVFYDLPKLRQLQQQFPTWYRD